MVSINCFTFEQPKNYIWFIWIITYTDRIGTESSIQRSSAWQSGWKTGAHKNQEESGFKDTKIRTRIVRPSGSQNLEESGSGRGRVESSRSRDDCKLKLKQQINKNSYAREGRVGWNSQELEECSDWKRPLSQVAHSNDWECIKDEPSRRRLVYILYFS